MLHRKMMHFVPREKGKKMSDRLIRAEALRQRMYHDAFETDTEMQRWDSGCWVRYKMFENALEDAPTIDAEPVRHGYWINYKDEHTCSQCYGVVIEEVVDGEWSDYDYCPFCGAKMNEVREDAKTN